MTYVTAGNLAVYAENSDAHVEMFARLMDYSLDTQFYLAKNPDYEGRKAAMNIPAGQHTYRSALKKFVSLIGPLSKKTVKEFAQKCEDSKERDELLGLCGMGGKEFDQKFTAQNVGLLDLVQMYPSMKIPFDLLI